MRNYTKEYVEIMFCISVLPFIVGDLRYRKGKIEFNCSVYCRNDVQQKGVEVSLYRLKKK